jgi:ATP-dependent Lon protease
MAYTSAGGDLLPIEVTWFKGKGNINITGNLKETMKESAQVALGYVKANADKFEIHNIDFNKIDIHIHVPSGGIPKDGPSAGVTLTTAVISALSNRPVPNHIAMTGEITLRGRVGIIGGVKEKVISAFRGGVNEIFIPAKDERYLEDVPKEILDKIKFHMVEHYSEIYNAIFKKESEHL